MKIETAAILMGGEGTRLRPLTINKPKALVPIVGLPLLTHILIWLRKYGIKEVIFILYYKKEQIKKVFRDGSELGLKIKYVEEDFPRGTGGALKKAKNFLKNTTLVINGDILTNINIFKIINFHKEKKADITISLVPVEDPTSYGLVKVDKSAKIIQFLEKPRLEEIRYEKNINAGIYIIEPYIINRIPENKIYSLERDLFQILLKDGTKFYGCQVFDENQKNYWIDVGNPVKYKQINYDILENKFKVNIPFKKLEKDVFIGKNQNISKNTIFKKPVIIGNNCRIGKNVYIERSILWDNVEINEGARLIDCIIADNCKIGKFVEIIGSGMIGRCPIIGEGTYISPYSIL